MDEQGAISDAERREAVDLLRRHWDAGTLDPGDHERRTTLVRRAGHRAELDEALAGLPPLDGGAGTGAIEPWPDRRGECDAAPAGDGGATSVSRRDDHLGEDGRSQGLVRLPGPTARAVVALAPFVALLLFFGLHQPWWVFLLIPIVGIVVYGGGRKDGC